MSLLGILNLGGSGLAAQQAALQVTGNNLSNAADPTYTREVAEESPAADSISSTGLLVGNGVDITSIQRQVDQALNDRMRSSDSDQSAATSLQTYAGQVQSVFSALSGNGLSDNLNTFFNDWSTLANNPADAGQRQIVIQDGQNLSQQINSISGNLTQLTGAVQTAASQGVQQVNQLTSQIATLNQQIVAAQNSGGQPNSLLDQRDATLGQLSQLVNIQTVNQANGSVNVYLGSEPLVQNTVTQTLSATTTNTNGQSTTSFLYQDGSTAPVTSGTLGGLLQSQTLVQNTANSVNNLASSLITSLNNLYSSGQGLEGYTSTTSTNAVTDPTQALSSDGLPSTPTSGSFVVQLTDSTTGQAVSYSQIPITETGSPGDTTLNSLATSLNGISGVQATVSNGQLTITSTNPNVQISFSQDTSGALTALGINTFFSGSNGTNIAVNSQVAANPSLLAASANGDPDDNTTALAIANLNDAPQSGLAGASLSQSYQNLIQNVGSAAANSTSNVTATTAVQNTLTAQQQNLSGVSTDEEALNMIIEQRTYEGSAELISTVNNMLQTLLSIT